MVKLREKKYVKIIFLWRCSEMSPKLNFEKMDTTTQEKMMGFDEEYLRSKQNIITTVLRKAKICTFTPSPPNFYSLPPKVNLIQWKNKTVIFSCSHCWCTIFVLISYYFETQIMLILILIDVQYSQNAVFSFENFSNRQNHSSGSHHLVKKSHSSVHYFLTQSQGNS